MMAQKRKRSQNFSLEEKETLLSILMCYKDTILNKKTDATTNEAKNLAWTDVTDKFNSTSSVHVHRTKKSLIKTWEKIKSESKLYYKQKKMEAKQTEGELSTVKIDPILEVVCSFIGLGSTGTFCGEGSDNSVDTFLEDSIPHDDVYDNIKNEDFDPIDILEVDTTEKKNPSTPEMQLWSRRQPQISKTNNHSEAAAKAISSSLRDVYQTNETIENLKEQLLREEIEFKRKLYDLQLQTAAKELEIKTAMLKHIQDSAVGADMR